jgi:hypothetical protein
MIMDNSQKISSEDLPTINEVFLKEEYKIKWDYYKELLINQKNIFDWYFKIVTIPASVFGVANIFSNSQAERNLSLTNYKLIFLIIFFCGLGLFVAFVIETGKLKMYNNRIKQIESQIYKTTDYREDQQSYFGFIYSVGFWRLTPIIIINSFLISLSLYVLTSRFYFPMAIFILSILLHFLIYHPLYKLGLKGRKK